MSPLVVHYGSSVQMSLKICFQLTIWFNIDYYLPLKTFTAFKYKNIKYEKDRGT